MLNKRPIVLSGIIALLTVLTSLGNVNATQSPTESHLPATSASVSTPPTLLLSDEEYARSTDDWDIQAFLETQPGPLKNYEEENGDYVVPASRAIGFYGELWGINPRVLLALLELESGLLSNATAGEDAIRYAMGNRDPAFEGFFVQLRWAVEELSKGFFDRYQGHNREQIVLADGTIIEPTPGINAGTFAIQRFLALGASRAQWETGVSYEPGSFHAIYTGLFGAPKTTSSVSPAAIAGAPSLRLPWAIGETWYYTGGPHTATAGGVNYNKAAVDFAPGGGSGCFQSGAWVRAANGGTVVYAGCNLVRIDHGGGWSTAYFHLRDIQVSNGQHVSAGTALGHPSCEYGQSCGWWGSATGSHVHFGTRVSNIPQKIHGTVLGGWTIQEGTSDYAGTMVEGSIVKYASRVKTKNNAILASTASNVSLDFTARLKYVKPNPRGHGADVEIVVTKVGKHAPLFSRIVTTNENGNYMGLALIGIVPGRYDLYAKPSGYLRRKAGNVYLQEGTNVVDFSAGDSKLFLPGDVDNYGQDNKVNALDFSVFVAHYWEAGLTDFNRDGATNAMDFSAFVSSYGKEGDGWLARGPFSTTRSRATSADLDPQDTAGSITLVPDSGTFSVGDTFDVQVPLDTGDHDSDGTNVTILYDPGVLQVQDADPGADGIQVTIGDVYDDYAENKVDPSRGEIHVAPMSDIGEVFRGSGTLATITFEVVASISNTKVKIYFQDGQSADSNIAENTTTVDMLGQAGTASFQTIGSPERPMPTISFTPTSNSVLQSSVVELEADVTDPYTQVKEVKFEVYQDGAWTTIGSDTYSPDGWGLVWDTLTLPHGTLTLRATALLLGGEGTTVTNNNIMLDKEPPTYVSSTFTPRSAPSVGVPVTVKVTTADQGSGVDRIDVYASPVNDQSPGEACSFLGSISGSEGALVWDTSDCPIGMYRIDFVIWDKAGNWGPDPQPLVFFGIGLRNVYLPLVARNR